MRPADTSPEAWKVFTDLIRAIPHEERFRRCLELTESFRRFGVTGLRHRYPRASEREIFLLEARQRLGLEIFRIVYGNEVPEYGADQRSSEANH